MALVNSAPWEVILAGIKGSLSSGVPNVDENLLSKHDTGQYQIMQKPEQLTETLAHGYSCESTQQELSNEYQHDRV